MLLPTANPHHNLYARTINRMGWSMLFFVALFSTTTGVSSSLLIVRDLLSTPQSYRILTAIYGFLAPVCYAAPFFLTGLFYFAISRKIRAEKPSFDVRIPREFPLLVFGGMAILTAAAYVNAEFCDLIGYVIPEEMMISESYDSPSVIAQYMLVAIAPAFAEEFLFRGVFYSTLRPFGRTQAVLVSSLLFALMHQNIGQFFYTFVGGIAMTLIYEITGSIWCSIFFHLFNNEMAILSEVLYFGQYGEAAVPYLSILDAVLFLLGIVSIIVLIVYYRKKDAIQSSSQKGIYGVQGEKYGRYEQPLKARSVIKGLLTPGMIVFTTIECLLMLSIWLGLLLIGGGGV